ncbi:MAG: DUF350 domain-containing protein [Candidatus Obscuribacterales bacterium]
MQDLFSLKAFIAVITYAVVGNIILALTLVVMDKLTPGDMWKEIITEKNLPFAITVAAAAIAVGNIVAAAVHG